MTDTVVPAKVVFACVANAGRSQMAAAFFNALPIKNAHTRSLRALARYTPSTLK